MKLHPDLHRRRTTAAILILVTTCFLCGAVDATGNTGTALWRSSDSRTPNFNVWDGSAFGTPGTTVEVGSWRILNAAEAPTRDEIIAVGVDAGGPILGTMWDGSSWTSLSINPLGTATATFWWGFEVAYETLSGDAVLVWNDTPDLKYSVWNGTTWSTPTVISAYNGTEPQQMRIAASPISDEMVLVGGDSNSDDFALVWTGSSWSNFLTLDTTSSSGDKTDVSVAYEQQSGRALVVYGKSPNNFTDGFYRIWNGATWSSEATIPAPGAVSTRPKWTVLSADPGSNRLVFGVHGSGVEGIWFSIWDGVSWGSSLYAGTDADAVSPNVAAAFESQSGDVLVSYRDVPSSTRWSYRTWTVGGGWSAEQAGVDTGAGIGSTNSMSLDSDPTSDTIMLSIQDSSQDLNYVAWNGSTWGTPSEQETATGETKNEPFAFVWDQAAVATVDLAVTKTVDDAAPNEGGTITFTVTLQNNGPNDATGVTVTDMLPPGLTYVSDTVTQGSYDVGSGVWTIGAVSNATTEALTITATVEAGTGGSSITNLAAVTSVDQSEGNPGNESASATIEVNAPPDCAPGGPYAGSVGETLVFDGTGSADADGTIAAYDWDFGDGGAATGDTPAHAYAAAGTFTVTLCVTDDDGAVRCCTTTADINALPSCDAGGPYAGDVNDAIVFDGTGSADSDGTIAAYDWDFGDGSAATGATPSHSYAASGTFTVTLCVTDDAGAVTCCATTAQIEGNALPICDAGGPYAGDAQQPIFFDGFGSSDPDGSIVDFQWQYGDGLSGFGGFSSHIYASAGTYTVTLCVTDDDDAVVCCSTIAEISDVNQGPSCDAGGPYDGLVGDAIDFDGSASSDADGTIDSFAWDFGDGTTSVGALPSHAYTAAGIYTVTVCVTDDDGASTCCQTTAIARDWTDATTPDLGDTGDGRGVAWADYDGDGDQDLYLANTNSPNKLFENQGGALIDITPAVLADSGGGQGVAWGDADGDDDLDLYLSNFAGPNRLYRNDGGGVFVEIANGTPLADTGNGRTVAWSDYDRDGDLDLYLANVVGPNRLFRNDSPGFSISGLLADTEGSQGLGWSDYDRDGDPDLFVANGNGPNRLYRNDTDLQVPIEAFVDVAPGTDLQDPTGFSLGAAWGDLDNDGDLDLYVGDNGGANRLYRNDGSAGGGLWSFTEIGNGTPVADMGDGRGLGWADHDNDGDLDLYLTNVNGSNKQFRNDGAGAFTDITFQPLDDAADSYTMAWADYDGDGDQDMYVTNNASPNRLYRNDRAAAGNHWLEVDLVGTMSNAHGIDARVEVEAGGVTQTREIVSGSGWYSQNALTAHFGLGAETSVDLVRVVWPINGAEQGTVNVVADQRIVVVEPQSAAIDVPGVAPLAFKLYQNTPNPFNPSTQIRFDVATPSVVTLRVYDVAGHLVRRLIDATYDTGAHTVTWDGRGDTGEPAPSGVYVYRIEAGAESDTRLMLMLK